MKATRFSTALLLTLSLAILVSAQQSTATSDPTDVVVLDQSWHKDFAGRQPDTNPLQPNEDYIRQARAEKQFIRQRDGQTISTTEDPRPLPASRPIPSDTKPVDIYVYEFKMRNTGAKKIKAVEWEYQFLHPDTKEVMGSRRIVTKVNLSPGKTDDVEARLIQKPTTVVSADQLDKKLHDQFKERLVIHRIEYADGSIWQRAP